VPAAAGAPAFTVQIESFLERPTARRWAERAEAEGLPAWNLDVELAGTPASRLRIGATATEEEALRLVRAVERQFGWSATVQRIHGGEAVPTNAMERTRDFLARQ
jgi:cell division septation protein DedD